MAEVFIYTTPESDAQADALCAYLDQGSVAYERIAADASSEVEALVEKFTDEIDEPFPLVRLGEEITAHLYNPSTAVLEAFFPECGAGTGDLLEDEEVEFFATAWCQDCWRVGQHLQKIDAEFDKIDIDAERGVPASIMRWTNGKRVVPSLQIGEAARLFNPSMTVVSHLLGKA